MMDPRVPDPHAGLRLPIERLGAPILRRAADPVVEVGPKLRRLVERMWVTMYDAGGQGIAAPQVGRGLRLAVVDGPPAGLRYVLVNPRIVWAASERARGAEGCLSIPGVRALVGRPTEVVVEALDLDGELRTHGAAGELARCFQHEIDHLNGLLYVARLSPLSRRLTLARYQKITRQGRRGPRAEERIHGRRAR